MTNWKLLITHLVSIKSQIDDLDKNRIWRYHLPNVAASQSQIDQLTRKLNRAIPEEYLDFLKTANGWKCFLQDIDLLGTEDRFGEKYIATLNAEFFDLGEAQIAGIDKNNLLPIAVNISDRDLFFIVLAPQERFGEVIWFAGDIIESFPNFTEYFQSMIVYNERELRKLK